MTRDDAIRRGEADGVAEVVDVLNEQGAAVVLATLRAGHLEWDEGAIGAGAHRIACVPDDLAQDYYRAYARAARAHAEHVTGES